jgi:hypothetical protein
VIQLVVDISLTPAWVDVFTKHGWPAVHWSAVGDPRAKDRIVMARARENAHIVFTQVLPGPYTEKISHREFPRHPRPAERR